MITKIFLQVSIRLTRLLIYWAFFAVWNAANRKNFLVSTFYDLVCRVSSMFTKIYAECAKKSNFGWTMIFTGKKMMSKNFQLLHYADYFSFEIFRHFSHRILLCLWLFYRVSTWDLTRVLRNLLIFFFYFTYDRLINKWMIW